MTEEKRKKAIAWLDWEIRSLKRAPYINGCGMKPEWAEQLEIMETCMEAVRACPPAHIDREAWTAEWVIDEFGHKCSKCGEYLPSSDDKIFPQFCPSCGRATTPDSLAELEERCVVLPEKPDDF